jgi:hypothetical protein
VIWDVTNLTHECEPASMKLSPEQAAALWTDLADEDAAKAFRAVWKLVQLPKATVSLLEGRLRRVAAVDARHLAQLVADLDSNRFSVRKNATAELEELGELSEPALSKALAEKPSLEVRQRIELLLKRLEEKSKSPEVPQVLRALEVLEHIGTPEAQRLLQTLSKGAPGARLTQEAKASLERLARRFAGPR